MATFKDRMMTRSEFRDKARETMMMLHLQVPRFDEREEEQDKRRRRATADPMYFCRTYLPHYFPKLPATFHYELVELLEQKPKTGKGPKRKSSVRPVVPVVVAAPREFAKTTVCSFGYVLHQICFSRRKFIIIGSDTEDLASDLTGYIYLELLYNERLRQDFGELVDDNLAVEDFITKNDVRLLARGRNQRMRGLKHKQWRPDLVILDDLENDLNVRNPQVVNQILDWIKSAVYPAMAAGGSLFIIGTILRWKSALHQMLTSPEEPYGHFERRIYRAIQEDGTSLWETKHPLHLLLRQKQLMGTVAFNREKMNEPVQAQGLFRSQWVHYYHPDSIKDKDLIITGFFDPSMETKASSDYKAVITVGLEPKEMVFYILDVLIQKISLEASFQSIFNRHRQYAYVQFGVEDNLFQSLLLKEFDRLVQEQGLVVPVKGVTHRVAKETRIASLSPLLERGKIRFIRGHSDQELLVEQLLYFPSRSIHDDGPDALEGAIRLAEQCQGQEIIYEAVGKRVFGGRGVY